MLTAKNLYSWRVLAQNLCQPSAQLLGNCRPAATAAWFDLFLTCRVFTPFRTRHWIHIDALFALKFAALGKTENSQIHHETCLLSGFYFYNKLTSVHHIHQHQYFQIFVVIIIFSLLSPQWSPHVYFLMFSPPLHGHAALLILRRQDRGQLARHLQSLRRGRQRHHQHWRAPQHDGVLHRDRWTFFLLRWKLLATSSCRRRLWQGRHGHRDGRDVPERRPVRIPNTKNQMRTTKGWWANATVFRNKDDKLTKAEFVAGMTGHPVIAKILAHKTIDSLLETF